MTRGPAASPEPIEELARDLVDAIARVYVRLGRFSGDHFTPTELKILDILFSTALIIAERKNLQFGKGREG